jgi:hypothetical protein
LFTVFTKATSKKEVKAKILVAQQEAITFQGVDNQNSAQLAVVAIVTATCSLIKFKLQAHK